MFDFILFENFYLAHNHYKDVCLIADLLRDNGYSVAIADVFDEGEYCQIEGVSHLQFRKKHPKMLVAKTRIAGYLYDFINKRRIDSYLIYVMRQLKGQYKHLYAGSYFTYMTTGWLNEIPSSSSVFFWGLRSARLIQKDKEAVHLRRYFESHPNLKFFISDEIIYKEFLDIGISSKQLVIRPERYLKELKPVDASGGTSELHLLTIGSIRRQKRVEKCLDAIRSIPENTVVYTIAGKADDEYEKIITSHREGLTNVKRLNYRIPEEEYLALFEQSDFLVLCDEQQQSSVTNGTMNEALLKGKPIIAPNYNPYKHFVQQYGVGLLYDADNLVSLKDAIIDAAQKGSQYFAQSILVYQKSLLFETVSYKFGQDLKRALTENR